MMISKESIIHQEHIPYKKMMEPWDHQKGQKLRPWWFTYKKEFYRTLENIQQLTVQLE